MALPAGIALSNLSFEDGVGAVKLWSQLGVFRIVYNEGDPVLRNALLLDETSDDIKSLLCGIANAIRNL